MSHDGAIVILITLRGRGGVLRHQAEDRRVAGQGRANLTATASRVGLRSCRFPCGVGAPVRESACRARTSRGNRRPAGPATSSPPSRGPRRSASPRGLGGAGAHERVLDQDLAAARIRTEGGVAVASAARIVPPIVGARSNGVVRPASAVGLARRGRQDGGGLRRLAKQYEQIEKSTTAATSGSRCCTGRSARRGGDVRPGLRNRSSLRRPRSGGAGRATANPAAPNSGGQTSMTVNRSRSLT